MIRPIGTRTERGFRIFSDGEVRVLESSIAFEGPCVRVFGGRDDRNDNVHLTLTQAKEVMAALAVFVYEAESGMLTEKVPS